MGTTITIDTIHIDQVVMTTPAAPSLRWHVGPVQATTGGSMPLDLHISTEERIRLAIEPMTPGDQPAPIDGEAQWSVEGTCTLDTIDATSVWVNAGSTVGDSVVTVSADADMGDGTVTIMDTATVHVASPMAANLGLSAGEPELKPSA